MFAAVVIAVFSLFRGYACTRPNIVIVVADDLGWNDVGFHSGDVNTPNIDALAYHGVTLGRHYSQPVCSPSRTALLTGDYPFRHGMQGQPCLAGHADGLDTTVKLMPQYFSKLGYRSHLVGKWHLGYQTEAYLPTRRGFDSFFGYLNGFLGYWDATHYTNGMAGRDFRRDERGAWREAYGTYLTDLLTGEAVKIIQEHPGPEGLLLLVSEAAVHATGLPMAREAPPGVTNITGRGYLRAMAQKLDFSVGEIVDALDKKGVLNNSIVVFISDNGGLTSSPVNQNDGSNWPLRGEKRSVHEGGVRTVAVAWSPLLKNSSKVHNQLFHISDWLPTLYAAAGGLPEDLLGKDGINQWPSLSSGEPTERETLVVDIDDTNNCEAIIRGKWKLVKNHDSSSKLKFTDSYLGESGRWLSYDSEAVIASQVARVLGPIPEGFMKIRKAASVNQVCDIRVAAKEICNPCLYDLLADPTECNDLGPDYEDVVTDLKGVLDGYRKHLVPRVPTVFDPKASPADWNDYWYPWK